MIFYIFCSHINRNGCVLLGGANAAGKSAVLEYGKMHNLRLFGHCIKLSHAFLPCEVGSGGGNPASSQGGKIT